MITFNNGSGLDVKGIERLSFKTFGVSSGGRKAVESSISKGTSNSSVVISGETLGETVVVPGNWGLTIA